MCHNCFELLQQLKNTCSCEKNDVTLSTQLQRSLNKRAFKVTDKIDSYTCIKKLKDKCDKKKLRDQFDIIK